MSDQGSAASRIHQLDRAQRAAALTALREREQLALAEPEPATGAPESVERADGRDRAGMSVEQAQIWALHALQAGDRMNYNLAWRVDLYGDLDPAALRAALAELVAATPVLRTGYRDLDGYPVAVPFAPGDPQLDLRLVDLEGPIADRRAAAERICHEQATQRFALDQEPPLRALLLPIGARWHVLMLTVHEIAVDAASRDLLLARLSDGYRRHLDAVTAGAADADDAPAGHDPGPDYADYVGVQQRWLAGDRASAATAAWRELMHGFDGTEVPFDEVYSLYDTWLTSHGDVESLRLRAEVVRAVDAFCRSSRLPLLTLLRAVQAAVLHRYSRQQEVVVGLVTDNRPLGWHAVLGNFENVVPARIDLSGRPSLATLLERTTTTDRTAGALARLPYPMISDAIDDRPLSDRIPLLMTAVFLDRQPWVRPVAPGLRLTCVRVHDRTARLDFGLDVRWADGAAQLQLEYPSTVVSRASALRFLERFEQLLLAAVGDPDAPVEHLPFGTLPERRQVLEEWNPRLEPVEPGTVVDRFAAQVARVPDRTAVHDQSGTELTYAELDRRSDALARRLVRAGVRPGATCVVLTGRSAAFVVAVLGVLKAGAGYVPVDHQLTPRLRVAAIIADCRPGAVVTEAGLEDLVPPLDPTTGGGAVVRVDPDAAGAEGADDVPTALPRVHPADLAYVMYTSGSSGTPKGVQIEHRSMTAYADSCAETFGLDERTQFLQFASVSLTLV